MGKIKGFLFAVRHREILMTDLGLRESDPLGKITVTEDTPFYKDSPIYGFSSEKKFPNYKIGMLERRGELWQYKSIFKGLDNVDFEKELNSYIRTSTL